MTRRDPAPLDRSAFARLHFPAEVITVTVRWYLRYGLSYRDVEDLPAERGIEVDQVTVYRWVQHFTPLFVASARPFRPAAGDRWSLDETYLKVAGRWCYRYRAIDQFGQVVDVRLSDQRDLRAARGFFTSALAISPGPVEVTTDRAACPRVLDELLPGACHVLEQYANNRVECDHGRLKARLRPIARTQTGRRARRSGGRRLCRGGTVAAPGHRGLLPADGRAERPSALAGAGASEDEAQVFGHDRQATGRDRSCWAASPARLAALAATVRGAPVGQRRLTLFWAACRLGECAGSQRRLTRAAEALLQAGRDAGLAEAEAYATLLDGVREGRS